MTAEEFARRVEAIKPVMYRVCQSQLRQPHDREDAAQEAILRAWEKRDSLREQRYFETWSCAYSSIHVMTYSGAGSG